MHGLENLVLLAISLQRWPGEVWQSHIDAAFPIRMLLQGWSFRRLIGVPKNERIVFAALESLILGVGYCFVNAVMCFFPVFLRIPLRKVLKCLNRGLVECKWILDLIGILHLFLKIDFFVLFYKSILPVIRNDLALLNVFRGPVRKVAIYYPVFNFCKRFTAQNRLHHHVSASRLLLPVAFVCMLFLIIFA